MRTGIPSSSCWPWGAFCGGGVLERFPRLKVAFLEGNCSWLPWVLYRLDERWEIRKDLCDDAACR